MTTDLTFKIIRPHNTAEEWHEWWVNTRDPFTRRDGAGKRQGLRHAVLPQWMTLRCNNPDCDAVAAVPLSFVTDHADKCDPAVQA